MKALDRIDYIKPEDIPNIDLVHGSGYHADGQAEKQHQKSGSDDKILTKTMINNYEEQSASAAGEEEYSKEAVLILIFILLLQGLCLLMI